MTEQKTYLLDRIDLQIGLAEQHLEQFQKSKTPRDYETALTMTYLQEVIKLGKTVGAEITRTTKEI